MDSAIISHEEQLCSTIERFWEIFPRIWHRSRVHVHNIVIEDHQLTMRQFAILRSVKNGRKSVSELAERGHTSRPAISRSVDTMVNKGLITRVQDPDDRRYVELTLTEDGERLFKTLTAEIREWMSLRLGELSEEQLNMITKALELLSTALEDQESPNNRT